MAFPGKRLQAQTHPICRLLWNLQKGLGPKGHLAFPSGPASRYLSLSGTNGVSVSSEFVYCAAGFVDRAVEIRATAGIGVRDRDPAEALASGHPGGLLVAGIK